MWRNLWIVPSCFAKVWKCLPLVSLARRPNWGAKYLVFSPLVLSKREKNVLVLLSLYSFLREMCLVFNFTIQKLKSKHTSLKKYRSWAKLICFSLFLREREEKKPNISHLWWLRFANLLGSLQLQTTEFSSLQSCQSGIKFSF